MAVSEAQICMMALSHFGRDANIQSIRPPDGSYEAEKCGQYYDQARDEVTERHEWSWSTRRDNLALSAVVPITSWKFAYNLPNKLLRTFAVYLPNETDDTNTQLYTIESLADGSQILYTNVATASIKYAVSVSDTSKFTPQFMSALSWLLAHYISGPITKNPAIVKECFQMYEAQLGNAAATAGNSVSKNPRTTYTPAHLRARNNGAPFSNNPPFNQNW